MMKELFKWKVKVNERANNGATPLHWAAQQGDMDSVLLLLENGANVHATTNSCKFVMGGASPVVGLTDSVFGKSSGQTPLHW